MKNAFVCIEGVRKSYPNNQKDKTPQLVLDDISIDVKKGEFVTIFGPNGCGKTTLLNIAAGLIKQDAGRVSINQKSPLKAIFGYVFQNYPESLLPWKRTIDNIAFPLELKGKDKEERRKKVRGLLDFLGLHIPINNYPYQLSGGQQQMAVIARSLIHDPDVLLMDEPFSALNFQTRLYMQDKIQEIWSKTKVTLLFVSHEIEEAIYMADRVIVLTDKPTHVAKSLIVPFPRPRTRDMTLCQTFIELKKEIFKMMEGVIG